MTEQVKNKSGCLIAFLVFLLIINALGTLSYFAAGILAGTIFQEMFPTVPGWTMWILGILTVLNIVFLIMIWKLKKIGFWGYAAVTIANFLLSIYMGSTIISALGSFIGLGILYLLLRPIWNHLE